MPELKVIENELVPIYETTSGEKVVYGTELRETLGVKSNYREWVKRRLNECEAAENEDFEAVEFSTPSGQKRKEHIIKLDTAKEMAMLERNEKGKEVRRYFIRIEKKYKARMAEHPQPVNQLQNLSPQLQALINMELKQKEQDAKIAALTDKTQKQEETLKTIHDTLFRDASDFRRWVVRCVGNIAISPSFDGTYNKYQKAWLESYDRLNEKVKCDLLKMVDEAKAKAKAEGATKSQIKNINRQSVIAENPGLREAYRLVIKEMLIAYCVEVA